MDSSPQLAYLLAKMADDQPEKLPTPASCTAGMKLTTTAFKKKMYLYTREWDWLIFGLLHTEKKKRLLSYSIVSNTLPRSFFSLWLNKKKCKKREEK